MWKKIISLLLTVLLFGCFLFARIISKEKEDLCKGVMIEIADSSHIQLLANSDILNMLANAKLNPKEKSMEKIDTEAMEKHINKSQFVARVECYKTIGNAIRIKVYQRKPFFRVFSPDGSYYVDINRQPMPTSSRFAPYVPVVSGNVKEEFAGSELFDFVSFIQNSSFWSAQIEQIFVESGNEIVLIPNVGDHEILLGTLENYQTKLENLQLLYKEIFNKVGWEKYKRINLKFDNQIVCTKR